MSSPLSQNVFLVKEHVGMFKASSQYDIYDMETNQVVMQCREENLGPLTKLFRFTKYKQMTPFDVVVRDASGNLVVRVQRGISIWLSKVTVTDENGQVIGGFKQKFFSLGGKFDVCDVEGKPVCTLKGKWTGWDFRFLHENHELAHVTKKWAGMGKELFTSADNYALQISEEIPAHHELRKLILAAVMCIDLVLKE